VIFSLTLYVYGFNPAILLTTVMENLSITHNTQVLFRKIMGVAALLLGVLYIVMAITEPKVINIVLAVMWTVMGSLYFISSSESNRSYVEPGNGFIKVRWLNWMRNKVIVDSEIEKVTLTRMNILIDRKDKKQVKLPLDFFETAQKKEVYLYFIELCRNRSITLENTLM
jgi:hypothetical protein